MNYLKLNSACVTLLAALALAACSGGGAFGGSGSGFPQSGSNGPLNGNGQPNPAASPLPSGADASSESAVGASAQPSSSPAPATALSVDSASARMALDPSAKQADRLIDVAFALKNPGTKPWTVRSVSLSADGKPLGSAPLAISALPGQTTQVWAAAIQLGREQDPAKFAHLDLLFADDHGKALARSTVDAPRVGTLFAPLDESHPAGPATLDSMDVERVEGFGRRPHFEVSFAVANPGKDKLTVAKITIAPPKGRSEDAQLNLEVPPRTATGVLTVVLPYPGKTLPLGKYAASIVGPSGSVIAKASADLI